MGSRPLMVATLLGASIGVPYFVSQQSQGTKSDGWSRSAARPSSTTPYVPPLSLSGPGAIANDVSTPVEGVRFHGVAEVLRFDLTREWVYHNWARKSTGLTDPELFGVRVPLVTGTGLTDLAGSLTYSFNKQGELQHISFKGRTADTTPLVQFLTQTYQFQRVAAPAGEQLYQVKRGSRVMSELRTRPDSVLWSSTPQQSIVVELELERPGSNRSLPPRTPRLEIPQVAGPVTPPAADADDAVAAPALIGRMRPATDEEQSQVLWRRWPN